ncbi:hypothetical protein M5W78_19170, partial [Paenibacillus larvae]|uniref:hypothetical protein n=1 Tax=Paenibacillus larvae TaxID=1464 RepID=UPI00227E64A3
SDKEGTHPQGPLSRGRVLCQKNPRIKNNMASLMHRNPETMHKRKSARTTKSCKGGHPKLCREFPAHGLEEVKIRGGTNILCGI